LSCERQGPERRRAGTNGRQHDGRRHREAAIGSARSKTPYMHRRTLRGNRESLCLPIQMGRVGKSKDTRR
jgi:hypothetical protein